MAYEASEGEKNVMCASLLRVKNKSACCLVVIERIDSYL